MRLRPKQKRQSWVKASEPWHVSICSSGSLQQGRRSWYGWGGGQHFPNPPPIFGNIEMRTEAGKDNRFITYLVPPDPQTCNFRRLYSAFLASILCFLFRYTVSVRVEEKQPYRQRTYTWCWAFPPRCSKYKIQIKTIYRTEVSFDWISSNSDLFFSHWDSTHSQMVFEIFYNAISQGIFNLSIALDIAW